MVVRMVILIIGIIAICFGVVSAYVFSIVAKVVNQIVFNISIRVGRIWVDICIPWVGVIESIVLRCLLKKYGGIQAIGVVGRKDHAVHLGIRIFSCIVVCPSPFGICISCQRLEKCFFLRRTRNHCT